MPRKPIRVEQPETVEEVLSKEKHFIPSNHLALDFQPVLREFRKSHELANSRTTRFFKAVGTMTPEAERRFAAYPELKASVLNAIRSGEFLQKTMVEQGETIHSPETEELLRKLPVRFKHVVVTENGGLEFRVRKPGFLKRFFNPVIKL
jgi:hypothetical protein